MVVVWLQAMTVHMTFNDTEEYSLRSIAILGCNICSQITVEHVTLPKAVLSTVKIFAVYSVTPDGKFMNQTKLFSPPYSCFWNGNDCQNVR